MALALDMMDALPAGEPYDGFGKEAAKGFKMMMPDLRQLPGKQPTYEKIKDTLNILKKERATNESSQAEQAKVCEWWESMVDYTNSMAEHSAWRVQDVEVLHQILRHNPYVQGLVDN